MNNLSIEQLILAVTRELSSSQEKRVKRGDPAFFEVSEMTLEMSFVVTDSTTGGGGLSLQIVKVDANKQYAEQQIQKVTLKFKTGSTEQAQLSLLPLRPHLDDDQ